MSAIPTRQFRRLKGAKNPKAAALSYQKLLTDFFSSWHEEIDRILLDGWDKNPIHFSGRVPVSREDALSSYVSKRLGAIKLLLEERFDPGTQLSRDVKTVAARVNAKNEIEFKRVIGISTRSVLPADQTFLLDAFRDKNVNLIKSLQNAEIDRITDILGEAEAGAWRVEELRDSFRKEFGVSKSKADLLARDQVLKLNGQLTQTRHANAGITEYIWTTSGDERVRGNPSGLWPDGLHYQLDGTRQSWTNPPVISTDGRTGHPGDDYQCRCTAFPILPELDDSDDIG